MRVLMITPYYYPIIGGTESLVETITMKLNDHGIHTDIMTFNYDIDLKSRWNQKIETVNNIQIIRVPVIKVPRPTCFINHLPGRFRAKLKQYDIIHFHNDTDLTFPLFAYGLNRKRLFHCHCLDTTFYNYKRNPLAKNILIRSADIFIALSGFLAKMLVTLGVPPAKIRVLPNGVNVNKFKGNGKKIPNLLLFVGRLDPKKGIPTLLASLKYLKKNVTLVIIGSPSTYQKYSSKIIESIWDVKNKTMHKILYFAKVKQEELIQWYQKASIVILPSVQESFPMVCLEALACETPVVASSVGAIPEIIRNHENGILTPPNNPMKLAEAIQYLLDNDQVRSKFGKKGREHIVKNFSSDVIAERLIEIYKSMLYS